MCDKSDDKVAECVNSKEKVANSEDRNVPIRLNDKCVFDGAFTFLKERFEEEMRRIEEEMAQLSKSLRLHCSDKTNDQECTPWDCLSNSTLIVGEGDKKTLKLQFDLSQFEPEEVVVSIKNNNLVVSAKHEEKSDANKIHNECHREFLLPYSVDPGSVESSLSKDGVLTVKAPFDMKKLSLDDVSK